MLPLLLAGLLVPLQDTAHVLLVATTDVHGQATAWDYARNSSAPGGLTRAEHVIDSLRDRYPDQVVLVDAGDVIEGSALTSFSARVAPRDPHPVIDAMNLMGYDAATPGNHEFNYGVAFMNRALSAATFPYVSGNIRVPPEDTLAFHPYVVVLRHGVRVGITGFTTPGVTVWDRDKVAGRLRVNPIPESAPPVLKELRRDADLIVVLVHSGMDGTSSYDTTGVGAENVAAGFARGEIRPDIVVVGHSHREMADSVLNGVHFVQPRPFALSLAVVHVDLVSRGSGWQPIRIWGQSIPLDGVPPNPRLVRRLDDIHSSVASWMEKPLGEQLDPMRASAARVADTPIMRFITGVMRRAARADLAAVPVFDPRAGFDPGEITIGEVFGLYPYDNTLRAVRLSGAGLLAYLEQSARYFYADSTGRIALNAFVQGYNYDIIGGAEYNIDLSRPPGSRIIGLSVRGRAVQPTDSFTLALSDYRQLGGGGYSVLRGARVVYNRQENIRDLLVAEVQRRRVLKSADYAGTSWRIVPDSAARAARALFVRDVAAAGESEPALPTLPLPPTRQQMLTRDSIKDAEHRADSLANPLVAALRLPAPAHAGGTALQRLLADAYRNVLRTDLAIVSVDETAADLPAGRVMFKDVETSVPGGHHLLTLSLSGDDLRWVLEHVVEGAQPCCDLSGATVSFDGRREVFRRVKEVHFASGRRLDRKATYTVAISEALLLDDSFVLGGTECGAGLGCAKAGLIGRWPVTRDNRTGADALRAYLPILPQPVRASDDRRLLPTR